MDERPIGVFDSGLGGISVLAELIKHNSNESFIYYGDTRHIPYGDKPPQEVLRLTRLVADKLVSLNCKALVIACNTATSAAASTLRQEMDMPVIGLEPALKPAALLPGDGDVLVMATRVTLALPKFKALMSLYGKDAIPVPCSGLMECVENGELTGAKVEGVLKEILAPYTSRRVKAVVLGCTHYVFLREVIAGFFPNETALLDGNEGAARQLGRRLRECGLCAAGPGGHVDFLSSSEDEASLNNMRAMLAYAQASLEREAGTAGIRI